MSLLIVTHFCACFHCNQVLDKFDHAFTCVFAIEMILKIIDLGIICHPGSYLREFWNIMDAVVVLCAVFSFAFKFVYVLSPKVSHTHLHTRHK